MYEYLNFHYTVSCVYKKATTENKFKQKRFDKRSLSLNRKNLKKEPLEVFCVFFRNLRCF